MKMCQIWLRLNYSSRDKGAATNHTIHSDRFLSETECSLGFRARLVVILKNPSQELPQQFTFLSKWQQNTPSPLYQSMKEDTVWDFDQLQEYIDKHHAEAKGLPSNWVFTAFTVRFIFHLLNLFVSNFPQPDFY